MNRRLYFILPDVSTAKAVEKDILIARIEDRRMHFLARRDIDLGDLPEASIVQKSDLTHGAFIGLITGAVTGVVIGCLLYLFDTFGMSLGFTVSFGTILILFVIGSLMGMWISGTLIGVSAPNIHLKPFEKAMEAGHILMMVDVPKDRVEEIRSIIKGHFPKAEDFGVEPIMPAFP